MGDLGVQYSHDLENIHLGNVIRIDGNDWLQEN